MQPEIGITVPTAADLLDIAHLAGGWPAVFSVNPKKEIWPYVTRGLTPLVDRRLVHGRVELLDQAAAHLLLLRPQGGRFCFGDGGVRLAVDGQVLIRFADN